jgi:branched-chain amino acid transport system permease protein
VLIALAARSCHLLVIRPVLDSAPINQLLVTGGRAVLPPGRRHHGLRVEFRNIGIRLGSMNLFDMSFSWSRIVTFAVALGGMLALWLFLTRPTWARRSGRSRRTGRSCR